MDATDICPDCSAAVVRMHHGFRADCRGCSARAAARSPHYHRVRVAGKLDRQYRLMLEQFALTHADVRAAADADALMR